MPRALGVFALAMLAVIPLAAADLTERRTDPEPDRSECGGERVAGVWRGRHTIGGWTYITTLHIDRAPSNALRGRMSVLAFTPGRRPPPCAPGQLAYHVTQPAEGRVEGLRVDFRARSYRIDRNVCGDWTGSYNPDHFTGTIDPRASILRAVNNDGEVAVDAPVMFRRVRCR